MSLLRDFKEQMTDDVNDVFLQDFGVTAIYKSINSDDSILVSIQFFEESLDRLDSTYYHAWASYKEVPNIELNDVFTINKVKYGVVDSSVDEFGDGINIFLQKVVQ